MSNQKKDNDTKKTDVFHSGEVECQTRAGVSDKTAALAKTAIKDSMSEGHQVFFSLLPMIFIAAADRNKDIWSSVLFGAHGFIQSKNEKNFRINSQLIENDPLSNSLAKGSQVGLLGIDFKTRRRNRVSAEIKTVTQSGFTFGVKQCYGNCPKYIQIRKVQTTKFDSLVESISLDIFTDEIINLIHKSDTLFIASQHIEDHTNENQGVDSSHRGGMPGFSRVVDEKTLLIPDYIGNYFFNTLGNISLDSKVGIQFIDFENGHRLMLTGTAEVIWAEDHELPFDGVDRMIKFTLKKGYYLKNSLPYTWDLISYSPFSRAYLPEK